MAVDGYIKQLVDERDQKVQVISNLAAVATDEGRDLHDGDLETIDKYRSRIATIDGQIEKVAGDLELADSVKGRIRQLDPNLVARDFSYRCAGDYLWDALHRHEDPDASARWGRFHRRAAEHMGYDKANTIPVAGGFNGLVVSNNVGPILDPRPHGRPLFTALGVQPIDSGTFLRPRIIDPNFTTGVDEQGMEKAELASKAWDIILDPVTGKVVGGYINVSELLVSMLSGALDMIVAQMNRRLEYYSEVAAVTEIDKTTAEVPLAANADAIAINKAIGQAAALVFANTGQLPTWLAMGAIAWGRLVGTSDLAGRALIGPGAINDVGEFSTSIAGLRVVVTPAITTANMYMGNAYGLEVYEKRLPVMSVMEPSVFGRQLSVQTVLAFYRPVTKEATATPTPEESSGIVRIEWA